MSASAIVSTSSATLAVVDAGARLEFTFADLMRYHGPGSPGGVAHAFQVLARALPELEQGGPVERTTITIRTPFGGPGARDGFELVTRAVTGGRFDVDSALVRPELGRTREKFVFVVAAGGRVVACLLREGFVTDEFIDLLARDRTPADVRRLEECKHELAERLMAATPSEAYDLE